MIASPHRSWFIGNEASWSLAVPLPTDPVTECNATGAGRRLDTVIRGQWSSV